jgi:hypothetical protein
LKVDDVVPLIGNGSNTLGFGVPAGRLVQAMACIESVLVSTALGNAEANGRGGIGFGCSNEKR